MALLDWDMAAQKMFSIKDFFRKYLQIWSHLLNFIFVQCLGDHVEERLYYMEQIFQDFYPGTQAPPNDFLPLCWYVGYR